MADKQDNFLKSTLRRLVARAEGIEEEIAELNTEKAEVFTEARAAGVDVKVMRVVMQRRRQETADVQERDGTIAYYEKLLAGGDDKRSGTKPATRARAREGSAS